jgi:single-strand DNA-binding protein
MLNICVLIGRLTKDPDLRYTPNGKAVATFTLAVDRAFSQRERGRLHSLRSVGQDCRKLR